METDKRPPTPEESYSSMELFNSIVDKKKRKKMKEKTLANWHSMLHIVNYLFAILVTVLNISSFFFQIGFRTTQIEFYYCERVQVSSY